MSGLRSALEEWAAQDLDEVHVDDLAEDLVELELVVGLVEAERARRLDRYRTAGGPGIHGYPSVTAFLIYRCRIASGRARRLVGVAHAALRCQHVYQAWTSGQVSTDQAHRLFEASDSAPREFADAEGHLVEIVAPLTPGDTRRALHYWSQSVTGPGESPDRCEAFRGISMSQTIGGMGRIDGWLTPTAYETLRTALGAHMPPPSPGDHRSAIQRRHDALEDLARHYLDHADTPVVGGERPHINLICDIPALHGIAGGRHETETGEVLTVDTVRQTACDATISRIVLGPDSEILDVGRRTRVIPSALRRAITARDRHCTYRGCERPARWCDVHHRQHWADGGATDLENCALLCRFHHTLIHRREAAERARPPGHPPETTTSGVRSAIPAAANPTRAPPG
jgi:hypothetical protein